MGVVEQSREHVEAVLATFETNFDEFPVNQTSVTVPPPQFERVSDRCRDGSARIDIYVRNDRGEVLVVDSGRGPVVPSTAVDPDDPVATRARQAVRTRTGVEVAVDGVREATITGVRDERAPDRPPIYRLIALLVGDHAAADPVPGARWVADPPRPSLLR